MESELSIAGGDVVFLLGLRFFKNSESTTFASMCKEWIETQIEKFICIRMNTKSMQTRTYANVVSFTFAQ